MFIMVVSNDTVHHLFNARILAHNGSKKQIYDKMRTPILSCVTRRRGRFIWPIF